MDWEYFEIGSFILVGVLGGVVGVLFIKVLRCWVKMFRWIFVIKLYLLLEVVLVVFVMGLIGYWNVFIKLLVVKLLYNLVVLCDDWDNNLEDLGLCLERVEDILFVLRDLLMVFLIKGFLIIIMFGIKVLVGIYVLFMVVGGLMGRMIGYVV